MCPSVPAILGETRLNHVHLTRDRYQTTGIDSTSSVDANDGRVLVVDSPTEQVSLEEGRLAALASPAYLTRVLETSTGAGSYTGLDQLPRHVEAHASRVVEWVEATCQSQYDVLGSVAQSAPGVVSSQNASPCASFVQSRGTHCAGLARELIGRLVKPPCLFTSASVAADRISAAFQRRIASAAVLQGGLCAASACCVAVLPEHGPFIIAVSGACAVIGASYEILLRGVKHDILNGVVTADKDRVAHEICNDY